MAEDNGKRNGLQNEIKAAMGQYNVDDGKEQLKTEVSTFNEGGVYVGLKLVSDFDQATNTRKEARPQLITMIDGKFVNFPKDGKWWKNFAEFASNFAQIMDGIDLNTSINRADVEYGQKMMAKFKKAQ